MKEAQKEASCFSFFQCGRFGSGVPDWNWGLNDGTGDSAFTQHITLGEYFSEVPVVVLGISGLDCTVYPVWLMSLRRTSSAKASPSFAVSTRKRQQVNF
jgi:hypothetical protein